MKKFKKCLAVMLAVVLTFSCMSVLGYSADEKIVPTIIVPGLFQSETHYYENGELVLDSNGQPLAAPFYISISKELIGDVLTNAIVPITKMFITQEDKDQLAAKEFSRIVGGLLMDKQQSDENGEFIADVRPQVYNGSFATLTPEQQEGVLSHFPVQEYFELADEEHLYVFNYVSTGNLIKTVEDLYDYIQFVKDDADAEKVNLVPVSQGGTLSNGLMKYYDEQGISLSRDVNRIVLTVPALDGAALLGDCYRYGINSEDAELYTTMFPSVLGKDAYLSYLINILLRLMPNTDVNNLLDVLVDTLVNDHFRYSTLLWGLIPTEDYPACREMYLSEPGLEEIRRQADWYYDAQLNCEKYILEAINDGVVIFDIVDTNVELYQLAVSYDEINADGMIHIASTSMGAYSVNVNEKLPEDYVPSRNNCSDPENHDHADPDGIVDVCAGLLPETTFYFSGQNHATTASNDVIMSLIIHILTDDNFTSVYSYPDKFPQFNYSRETLQLRKDVDTMREYDTSALAPEIAEELEGAIAQVDEMLENTVVNPDECKQASDRFYNVYGEIQNADGSATGNGLDQLLYTLLKTVSDILYTLFGAAGFSEMSPIFSLK